VLPPKQREAGSRRSRQSGQILDSGKPRHETKRDLLAEEELATCTRSIPLVRGDTVASCRDAVYFDRDLEITTIVTSAPADLGPRPKSLRDDHLANRERARLEILPAPLGGNQNSKPTSNDSSNGVGCPVAVKASVTNLVTRERCTFWPTPFSRSTPWNLEGVC
jgi:hypothetical protein